MSAAAALLDAALLAADVVAGPVAALDRLVRRSASALDRFLLLARRTGSRVAFALADVAAAEQLPAIVRTQRHRIRARRPLGRQLHFAARASFHLLRQQLALAAVALVAHFRAGK